MSSEENQSSAYSLCPCADSESPVSSDRVLRSQSSKHPQPPNPRDLFYTLKSEIIQANGPSYIERGGIPQDTGSLVARSLAEDGDVERKGVSISFNPSSAILSINMPTATHEAVHDWVTDEFRAESIVKGFFTRDEQRNFAVYASRRYDSFPPPWNNAYKEPDAAIAFRGVAMPMIAVEVGYSESWPKLVADKLVWMLGGAPHVNAVLLVKWNIRTGNRISGFLELHRRGSATPTHLDIFPVPAPGAPPQSLAFSRQDFYPPGQVPVGRNANDVLLWSLDNLRDRAEWAMGEEGFCPA